MGIDVNLYVEGDITDDEFDAAFAYMEARVGRRSGDDLAVLERNPHYADPMRIEFGTLERYYGPGYERGYWPGIYAAIMAMRHAFPGRQVFYGGDTTQDAEAVTDERLDAIWQHWLGPDGDNYYGRR